MPDDKTVEENLEVIMNATWAVGWFEPPGGAEPQPFLVLYHPRFGELRFQLMGVAKLLDALGQAISGEAQPVRREQMQ